VLPLPLLLPIQVIRSFPVVLQLGATPLHRAAGAGQLAATEMLLTEGKSKINVKDKHGETPMFLAAASGHEEVGVSISNG
jgi:ankyrin repeat protein